MNGQDFYSAGGMRITARRTGTKPEYGRTAAEILAACRVFYQDPENERAFLEWKAGKEGKNEERAV